MVFNLFRKRTPPGPQPGAAQAAVPEGSVVYAVGDVHGCAPLLRRLHGMILADAHAIPDKRRVVV